MTEKLNHSLQGLLQDLLKGKLPRSLSWNHAVALIEHLGQVEGRGDNEFVFAVGTQRATFKRPGTHELDIGEVSRLRRFLRDADADLSLREPLHPRRIVVVIDHHAAHIYQEYGAGAASSEHTVRPYDPFNFHHHLIHRKEAHYSGDRVPEESSFYEAISRELIHALEIVIVGHGKGKSNASEHLSDYLKTHHPDLFGKVIDEEKVDLSAFPEPQIAALAGVSPE